MPVHAIPRQFLHDRVAELETAGERVVAVVPDGHRAILVVTETVRVAPGGVEHR